MRRTARALSVAVLAGAALGVCAGTGTADPGVPPPPADAGEPAAPPSAGPAVPAPSGQTAAQVSPADAAPGDTVTVSVSCAPTGALAPASLDATSAAFEEGTVALRKVADDGGTASGPTYRGTARVAAVEDVAAEGTAAGSADPEDAAGTEDPAQTGDWAETDEPAGAAADDWTVDGACPDASGGEDGAPWSATMRVPEKSGAGAGAGAGAGTDAGAGAGAGSAKPTCRESEAPRAGTSAHGTPCAPTKPACPETAAPHGGSAAPGTPCGGATAEHGVQAGAGGTFGDSVPALVAGGVLIAGACGAAAHRLRLRLRGQDGRR